MDDRLIRYLKLFVIGGAVVLVLGTSLLAWLLTQRQRGATAAPEAAATTLPLPADARIAQAVGAGNQLVLIGEAGGGGADGAEPRRFLAVLDLQTGRRRYLLWITPEAAPAP